MPRSTINGTAIDLDGKEMILDADQDTTLTVDTDDRVDIKVAGTDTIHIDATGIGVNVTNPLYPFHTRAASGGDNAALFLEGPNNGYSTIYMGDTDDIDIGSIQYNHSSNYMLFQTNNAEAMRIDSIGAVTKPLQPAFLARVSTPQNNISANTTVTFQFTSEVFDQGADYDTSTYTFTAPVTGKYMFGCILRLDNVDEQASYYDVRLTTSNRSYQNLTGGDNIEADANIVYVFSALADMDANDTAKMTLYQSGGTAQSDLQNDSTFSGFLAC